MFFLGDVVWAGGIHAIFVFHDITFLFIRVTYCYQILNDL
jgi:hypothetical protein